jgi:hypothetical protein
LSLAAVQDSVMLLSLAAVTVGLAGAVGAVVSAAVLLPLRLKSLIAARTSGWLGSGSLL